MTPPKVELQDLLNATGLGFSYLLTSLIATLLNAAHEPRNDQHVIEACNICEKLRTFADRPSSPMPLPVVASFLNNLGPQDGQGELRYVALALSIWQKEWSPASLARSILSVHSEYTT